MPLDVGLLSDVWVAGLTGYAIDFLVVWPVRCRTGARFQALFLLDWKGQDVYGRRNHRGMHQFMVRTNMDTTGMIVAIPHFLQRNTWDFL